MTNRVTEEMIHDQIETAYCFTAAEGIAGAEFAKSFSDESNTYEDVGVDTDCAYKECDTPLHLLTLCVIKMKNGFTVVGESSCADPANFDKYVGEQLAFENAKKKMWPLLGFRLKDQMAQTE